MKIDINMTALAAKALPTPTKEDIATSKALAVKLMGKFPAIAKRLKLNVTDLTSNSYPSTEREGFNVHHITGKLNLTGFVVTIAQKGSSNYYETIKAEGRAAGAGYSALPKAKVKGTAAEVIEPILAAVAVRDRRGAPRDGAGGGASIPNTIVNRDLPQTEIVKSGVGTKVSAKVQLQATRKHVYEALESAKAQVASLTAELKELDAALAGKGKTKGNAVSAADYTFVVTGGRATDGLKPKQRTFKGLVAATGAATRTGKFLTIDAVHKTTGTSRLIMRFSTVDPITGKKYRGYSWFFVTEALKSKFQHLLG